MSPRLLGNPTVAVVAVTYGVLLKLAIAAGLFGIVLGTLVFLSLWRYAYAVLRQVASGRRNLPPPGIETMNPVGGTGVVLHGLLFASATVLLVTTPLLGDSVWAALVRWSMLAAVASVFPASAAVMSMTTNLVAALNPADLKSIIGTLGRDYRRLLGACAALLVALLLIEELLATSWLLDTLGGAVAAWGLLALFLLIGTMLREHRADFDLLEGLDDAEQRRDRERRGEWQKTLDRAYASIRSGLPAQAYRTIKELLASEGDSLEIYQWVFNGMLLWDEPEHATQVGERFVERLWEADRKLNALELAQQCQRLSPSFSLPRERVAELVAYARSLGRHRLADEVGELPLR